MPAPQSMYRVFLAVPIFAAIFLSGCGGSDNTDNDDPTFNSLWKSDFSSCGTNCHNASAADGTDDGPDMSTQSAFYDNLVNKNANDDYPDWMKGSDCDSPFITPSDAAKSTLMASLIESYSDELGAAGNCITSYNLHVLDNVTLSDSAAVVEWINQGAPNN